MRVKIAFVSEHASPLAVLGGVDAGGQNVHVAALSDAMARHGHEVRVYTRRDSRRLPRRTSFATGVMVDHIDAGPPDAIPKDALAPHMDAFGDQLVERWSRWRPDVVHAHFWMSGLASLRARDRSGVPVVQTFHALGSEKRRHQGAYDTSPPHRLADEVRIARECDHIVATASAETFELARMGARRSRVTIVPCGVDLAHFSPHGPAYGRIDGVRRIVVLGRLVERKGVDDVIRAAASLKNVELIVAGGPSTDALDGDPEVLRLSALATAVGLNAVRFSGRLSRAEVPLLLRSADVVVCYPWYEPFGIVPLEAMACGVPVVAASVGGLVDTVVDGVTGMHVAPRRPDLLAAALERLLDDAQLRKRFGANGVARCNERYGWQRVARDTVAVYARLLERASKAVYAT